MNPVIAICYHGGAQRIFDMTLPLWEKFGLPMAVLTPWDDPLKSKHFTYHHGESSFTGPKSRARIVRNLVWFTGSQYDSIIIAEADSICLLDKIDFLPGFHGIVHVSVDSSFMCPRYALGPWMLDKESAAKMLDVAIQRPDVHERGCDDRFYSALAQVAGVPIEKHEAVCYAENTIHDARLVPPDAKWIHGTKSPQVLKAILDQNT